ncbi:hypothetical protein J7643_03440 [bacterium]|nr:hypothetical protein [bacterium]
MRAPAPAMPSAYLAGMPREQLSHGLWDRYVALLTAGVPSESVQVWLEGATRTRWTGLLKGEADPHIAPEARPVPREAGLTLATGQQRVQSPAAFIKEELRLYWPFIEEKLENLGYPARGADGLPRRYAEPGFTAIDLSQYLMNRFTASLRTGEDHALSAAESPAHLQNIQLLDALARGIENGYGLLDPASAPAEAGLLALDLDRTGLSASQALARAIARRLAEGAVGDAALFDGVEACLDAYVSAMLTYRLLDHGMQLELYASFLFADPQYRHQLCERLGYLLVERLDELSPRLQGIIRVLSAEGVSVFATLQADVSRAGPIRGGLRAYVGADPQGAWELVQGWEAHGVSIPTAPSPAQESLARLGAALHEGVLGGYQAEPVTLSEGVLYRADHYAFEEMLDAVAADLVARFEDGVGRDEVAVVAPAIDAFLLWGMQHRLAAKGIPLYVFAGTNRLIQNRAVRILMTLAKLCHPEWELPPGRYEWIELLELETGLNPLQLGRLADHLTEASGLAHPDRLLLSGEAVSDEALGHYRALFAWVEAKRAEHPRPDLAAFIRQAFAERYAPARLGRDRTSSEQEAWQREISQIGQLIELAEDYRDLLERIGPAPAPEDEPVVAGRESWGWAFLRFLHAGTIAERPFFRREPHQVSVTLASASQLAEKDLGNRSRALKHLYLLDFGSPRWLKRDRKELTNARVLAKRYPGGIYDLDQEERDAAEKLAKTLWALCRLPTESLRVFGCMTDAEGREQAGELPWLLETIAGRRP